MPGDERPLLEWQVENLRLTVLLKGDQTEPPVEEWWRHVAGKDPEEENRRPQEGLVILTGRFESGILSLEYQPLRIDIRLQCHPEQSPQSGGFSVLGSFESMSDAFVGSAGKILELDSLPPTYRVAYGVVILYPVSDRAAGYRQLQAYLPTVEIDAENSSDFLYRVNRRRQLGPELEDLTVNRLSNWSVAVRRSVMACEASVKTVDIGTACRLELDINTSTERRTPLPQEHITEIVGRLVEMSKEIARNGDIK